MNINIDFNIRHFAPEFEKRLDEVIAGQQTLRTEIMRTLDEVLQTVRASNTLADSVLELLSGFRERLDEALREERLSAETQQKINAIFDEAEAQRVELVAAVQAHTPAEGANPDAPGGDTGGDTGLAEDGTGGTTV